MAAAVTAASAWQGSRSPTPPGSCFRKPRPRKLENILADIAKRPERTKKVGLWELPYPTIRRWRS